MERKPTYDELKQSLHEKNIELTALFGGAQSILKNREFVQTAREIFDQCCEVIGSTSGYIALLNDAGEENEVLFLEAGGRPCTVDPSLPMPIRGLRGEVYNTGVVAYDNDFWNSQWMKFMPKGHVTLDNVLFAPLNISNKTVGLMGLANKPGGFNENDARLATLFGNLAAIALENSRNLESLQNSEVRYRSVVENASDAIITFGADYIVSSWNSAAEKIFGFKEDQIIGNLITKILPAEFIDKHVGNLGPTASNDQRCQDHEALGVRFDESQFPLELSLSKVNLGETELFTAIVRDISFRKHSEEKLKDYSENLESMVKERTSELEKAQAELIRNEKLAAIGKLSSSVAHDLRNPLGAISNSVYFLNLVMKDKEEDKVKKHIAIMEREVGKANTIINDLMEFATVNSPNLSMGDINNTIKSSVNSLQVPEGVTFELELSHNITAFEYDASQIQRVIENLLANSIQVLSEGGSVFVSTKENAGYVEVVVADQGDGISDENLENIFEPLFTTKAKGTGLGLSIVKTFVEKHKGTVDVESQVGEGTRFIIRLPCKADNSPTG